MSTSRIVSMLGRRILRQLLSRGVNAGIDKAYGAKKPTSEMTPEERARHQAAMKNAGRSKKAVRMIRRFGRF